MILAEANPDGLLTGRRTNANGVDVNRNFPARNWRRFKHPLFDNGPSPASEPETRAILAAIEEMRPGRIVSIH
jgi:murein tripeptide amidase MpaA